MRVRPRASKVRRGSGQTLVEFAFVLPIMLFLILCSVETAFLLITKAHQDRATSVVAEWAALHPGESWNAVANKELPGCVVDISSPLPELVQATSWCQYSPKVGIPMFDGLLIQSQEMATSMPPASPKGSDPLSLIWDAFRF